MDIIDPRKIKKEDLPLIVLSDDRRGLLGFIIKNHTHGNYNHIMELYEEGTFASQDPKGFREIPVKEYMKPYIMLKFWKRKNMTLKEQDTWHKVIQGDLNAPWADRKYDFLGIVGQFLGIPWLNNNHLKYCSERVYGHIKAIFSTEIFKHPTPNDMNTYFKEDDNYECVGYWFSD